MKWVVILLVAASACTSTTPIGSGRIPDELARTARLSNIPIGDYRLAPGDVIAFRVIGGDQSFDTVQSVRRDGKISLPYIGDQVVAGLTMQEARERLRDVYVSKGILKSSNTPTLSLER